MGHATNYSKAALFFVYNFAAEILEKEYVGKNIWKRRAWHHGNNGNS